MHDPSSGIIPPSPMREAAPIYTPPPSIGDAPDSMGNLRCAIAHAVHLLPSQGPITVFVHHNTLHAFEELTFEEAVKKGLEIYDCQPYLAEEQYRAKLASGRIRPEDISAVLLEDLADDAEVLVGFMGTRYHLRAAMLEHSLRTGSDGEIRWLIAETDALKRFQPEAPTSLRSRLLDETRTWVKRELHGDRTSVNRTGHEVLDSVLRQFRKGAIESWSTETWEAFTLQLLWRVCQQGVHGISRFAEPRGEPVRHRDLLWQATGEDSDGLVNEFLIRFCSSFLDQGFANWPLPQRNAGFLKCFAAMYQHGRPRERWLSGLPEELQRLKVNRLDPLQSIEQSLRLLGVEPAEWEDYVSQTLLALRGWAGMLWQMETNAEWTVHPAPAGTLQEYLAVRLILERLAVQHLARRLPGGKVGLADLRGRLRRGLGHAPRVHVEQRAYTVFQLAQVRGWSPLSLNNLSKAEWSRLVQELELFSGLERRRIYHLAFERRYRRQALDAIALLNAQPPAEASPVKSFQIVTCIDDREESFHRHLEEIDPRCQTLSAPGFFAVAMYYQGIADAHFRPLCPVVIKPQHFVREAAAYSLTASNRQRAETRRTLGTASHQWHVQSRTLWGGILTALLGSLASVPLVARILFPRLTAQARRLARRLIQPPSATELMLTRTADPAGPEDEHLGFTVEEMANCVERVLRDIGLTRDFARIVLFVGHGSDSLNNPHESAYNCGACSGGRGGPNARSYAWMANHPAVRRLLFTRGVVIPDSTIFIGGYHDTCDEDVDFFDLDRIPATHRQEFERIRDVVDEARARNAQERVRRFESANRIVSATQALEHVQTRSEDLSQARPEYNHATNAMCIVGRRQRTRGLFMDRRVFISDYDPTQDDEQTTILARILAAAVPVCAGISLEYYFSCVDVVGYGCGSKLPHNIVSLLGVMEGAATDLRPGLSQQMIEIHEPMRILFLIETTPHAMLDIMRRNPVVGRLIENEWVQLAVLDPHSAEIQCYQKGVFRPYQPETDTLPVVASSREWYRGQHDHLGFARIVLPGQGARSTAREAGK